MSTVVQVTLIVCITICILSISNFILDYKKDKNKWK